MGDFSTACRRNARSQTVSILLVGGTLVRNVEHQGPLGERRAAATRHIQAGSLPCSQSVFRLLHLNRSKDVSHVLTVLLIKLRKFHARDLLQ